MRLYRFDGYGDIEHLRLVEMDVAKPGPGEVLVRVRAASLNYRDILVMKGTGATREGIVPLSDGAGEVAEVGPGVSRFKPGDRVAGIFMQNWISGRMPADGYQTSSLGGGLDGMLAEYRVFSEDGLVSIPEHLSFQEAATLPCAGVTAWNALFCFRPLIPGQALLALGTGGVSVFAAQFALAAGARPIVTSSSDAKLEQAAGLGATDGINYRTHPEWHSEVRRLMGGEGVDHVIEIGGPGTLEKSIKSTRIDGSVHLIGGFFAPGEFNPGSILAGRVHLRGLLVGSREMFEDMNKALAVNRLRPVIDRVFPFAEARDAYRHLESGSHFGKIVIGID